MSKQLSEKIKGMHCCPPSEIFGTEKGMMFQAGFRDAQAKAADLALCSAAAPQVVADERAAQSIQSAFEKAAGGCVFGDASRLDAAQDWFKQGYRAAAPVQAQEPVPEAAQQNGGLVRAALIDLMALEREATSACDGFKAQRDCNLRFARARKALADSADTAPVHPVAVPDGWKLVPIEPTAAMKLAADSVEIDTSFHSGEYHTPDGDKIYSTMLATAPEHILSFGADPSGKADSTEAFRRAATANADMQLQSDAPAAPARLSDASEVDYAKLLAKYIEHVGAEEGCDFINRLWLKDGVYVGYGDKAVFSPKEYEALDFARDFDRAMAAPAAQGDAKRKGMQVAGFGRVYVGARNDLVVSGFKFLTNGQEYPDLKSRNRACINAIADFLLSHDFGEDVAMPLRNASAIAAKAAS